MSDNITVVGNIVGEPEQRTTRAGEVIAAFRLAAGDRRFDRDRSQWVEGHTNYYAVSVFGELGRHALASFRKGERVIVSGRLTLREWETDAKRGLSADVTATAVGHDLRWGVSRFEREKRPAAAPPAATDAPAGRVGGADEPDPGGAPASGGGAAEEWSVPGGEREDERSTAHATEGDEHARPF